MEVTIGYMLALGLQAEVQEIMDNAILKTTHTGINYLVVGKSLE